MLRDCIVMALAVLVLAVAIIGLLVLAGPRTPQAANPIPTVAPPPTPLPSKPTSPLTSLMKQLDAENRSLNRLFRAGNGKPLDRDAIQAHARTMSAVATTARAVPSATAAAQRPLADWQASMDRLILASDALALQVADDEIDAVQLQQRHATIKKSCDDCHQLFRQ
jgi:cytochrome c556